MIETGVLTAVAALISLVSAVVGSTCWACFHPRHDATTIELLEGKKVSLDAVLRIIRQKHNTDAVLTSEQTEFMNSVDAKLAEVNTSIAKVHRRIDEMCVCGQRQAQSGMRKINAKLNDLIKAAESINAAPARGYKPCEVTIVGEKGNEEVEKIWKTVSGVEEGAKTLVCIHGTLGVGKTMIAKYIHHKALQKEHENLFDYVIWVTLEDRADTWQVQEKLAKSLKIDLRTPDDQPASKGDTVARAEILNEILTNKKFLLFLDSMWQHVSLGDVGIPKLENGNVMIVTSRLRNVCDEIHPEEPAMFEIQLLTTKEEAWELFRNKIEARALENIKSETVHASIKKDLLVELDGLPLAIIKFARRLNNMNTDDIRRKWRKELACLARKPFYREATDPEMFDRFTVSYKNLNEKTRQCFLYCALFPKDHLIETKGLIEYWIWEDLLGTGADQTLGEATDEGADILEELINAHLLQSASTGTADKRSLKMLRLVHTMVYGTIDREKKRVCIKSGGILASLPPSGSAWNSNVERASFMKNRLKILDLKENLICNQLSTLLLQDNPLDLGVEENLFSSMPNLKVLDISQTKISSLPNTLSDLGNLRALLLRNCANLTGVPDLSNLQQVIVLDFLGTPLQSCPRGLRNMTKLRRLDLSQTKIAAFPANVASHLINLEELLVFTDNECKWGSSVDKQWNWACIEELLELSKLAVLQLHLLNAEVFNTYLNMGEQHATVVPPKFNIRVGVVQAGEYAEGNSLAISGLTSTVELNVTSLLKLSSLNVLDVSNFTGLSYLFSAEILGSLTELRELRVRSCTEMVEVVLEAAQKGTTIHVPHLMKMVFFELPRLKSICCEQTLDCPELASVRVWNCGNLKLPIIRSQSNKIQIIGEKSWHDSLKSDGHLDENFWLVEDHVLPAELVTYNDANQRKNPQGGDMIYDIPRWLWPAGNNDEAPAPHQGASTDQAAPAALEGAPAVESTPPENEEFPPLPTSGIAKDVTRKVEAYRGVWGGVNRKVQVVEKLVFHPNLPKDKLIIDIEDQDEDPPSLWGVVLGNPPPIAIVRTYIDVAWEKREVKVRTFSQGLLVFEFAKEEDLEWVMENGPWMIGGVRALMFARKVEGTRFDSRSFTEVPVWVVLPNLHQGLRSKYALNLIGSTIGIPICLDQTTSTRSRLGFTRMLVLVSVEDTFRTEVIIENSKGKKLPPQKIIYEWLPLRCTRCECFGHSDDLCRKRTKREWRAKPGMNVGASNKGSGADRPI